MESRSGAIDIGLIEFLNAFATKSFVFDRSIGLFVDNRLLKGGVIVAIFYWAWFSFSSQSRERSVLLIALIATPFVVVIARLLALNLPFRQRPIHDDELDFTIPIGIKERAMDGWSSFPSDHAVLYFSISVGIFLASRRLGSVAIAYSLIFIGFPRVYVGYHYPTDVVGGCLIGGGLILSSIHIFLNSQILDRIRLWSDANPGAFYAMFFLITFEMASLFDQSREIVSSLHKFLVR